MAARSEAFQFNFPEQAQQQEEKLLQESQVTEGTIVETWVPTNPDQEDTLMKIEKMHGDDNNYYPSDVVREGLILAGHTERYSKIVGVLVAASMGLSERRRDIDETLLGKTIESTAGQWVDFIYDSTKEAKELGDVHKSLGGASGVFWVDLNFAEASGIDLSREHDIHGNIESVILAIQQGLKTEIEKEMFESKILQRQFNKQNGSKTPDYNDKKWVHSWSNWLAARGSSHDLRVGLSAETAEYKIHAEKDVLSAEIGVKEIGLGILRTGEIAQKKENPLFDIVIISEDATNEEKLKAQGLEEITNKGMAGRVILSVDSSTNKLTGMKFEFSHFSHDEVKARKYIESVLNHIAEKTPEPLKIQIGADTYEEPQLMTYRESKKEGRVGEFVAGFTLSEEEAMLIKQCRKAVGNMGLATFATLVSSEKGLWDDDEGKNCYMCVAPKEGKGNRLQMALTFGEKLGYKVGTLVEAIKVKLSLLENVSEDSVVSTLAELLRDFDNEKNKDALAELTTETDTWLGYVGKQVEMAQLGMCYPWILHGRVTKLEKGILQKAVREAYNAVSANEVQISSVQWDKPFGIFTTAESLSVKRAVAISSYLNEDMERPLVNITIRERYEEGEIRALEVKKGIKPGESKLNDVVELASEDLKRDVAKWRQNAILTALVLGAENSKEFAASQDFKDKEIYDYFNLGNPPKAFLDAAKSLKEY